MIRAFSKIFSLYVPFGVFLALKVIVRILVLPFWKIDRILPKGGVIIDIGCGDGGLTNYLSIKNQARITKGIDISKSRIGIAKKTISNRKNIEFWEGNSARMEFNKASAYLLVDVLHHISFIDQELLLKSVFKEMNRNSLLVIKEVDKNNFLPYWFGHIIEKALYPKDIIYIRSKDEWFKLLTRFGLSYKLEFGTPLFPDSTLIFICKKKI